MIGVKRQRSLQRYHIAIAPGKVASAPVKIRTVSVGEQQIGLYGKVRCHCERDAICRGLTWCRKVAIAGRQDKGPRLSIVQIEEGDLPKPDQGFQVELHAGAYLGLGGAPSLSCIFCLSAHPYIRIEF